jgi:S1-C subfamily serine protease
MEIPMKRTLFLCLVSAFLGGLLALAAREAGSLRTTYAQDPAAPVLRQPGTSARRPLRASPLGNAPAPVDAHGFPGEELSPEEQTNIRVYERANQSVVHITTKADKTSLLILEVPTEGTGSGSVLDKNGHILTNNHVVDGAQEIRVTLASGESFDARLVGRDLPNDIAVLRVAAPADLLVPIELGDSSRLKVGQIVYAIGNPFGLDRTMSSGIISSLNRALPTKGRTMRAMIQIDAALNRGNSGGPLLDTRGRLIGMNTAIASSTGENTGVGFAIPVDTLRRVASQLIETGHFVRADAGITHVLPTERGLTIVMVAPGGPAERAGLRGFRLVREQERRGPFVVEKRRVDRSQADTIISVDGKKVASGDEFLELIERLRPGEEAVLGILRGGQIVEVPLTLTAGE